MQVVSISSLTAVLCRGGPLQTGGAVDKDIAHKALSVLLTVLFRSILSIFRFLLPSRVLDRADAVQDRGPAYHPITDLVPVHLIYHLITDAS